MIISSDADAGEEAVPLCKNTISAFSRRFEERPYRDMKKSLKPKCSKRKIYHTSGFWPRVRARALRAPVFLDLLPRLTGRCAPPLADRSLAAPQKIKK